MSKTTVRIGGDLAGSISLVKQITKETGDQLEETARNAMLLRDNPDIGFEITESLRAARGMMKNFASNQTRHTT
ncbi:hypothetical protein [Paenibacillus silviterrae]|uniref:hypothetical protein n=1 Tax=Paenibacillus silviterrae TaxID=3242194 RepID=UPI002542F634|nr:hypothetical protein [Paenibacillus chinjuensis]